MRPALLRLLRRPFAVSTLDALAASSFGIEQLAFDYARLRVQSQCLRHYSNDNDAGTHPVERTHWPRWRATDKKRPLSFPIHEIEISTETDATAPPLSHKPYSGNETLNDTPAKFLRLHPERLEFESNIGHIHDPGTRLVDQPQHSNDFELWEELLHHRQRHYGDQGSQEIWEGFTVRLQGLQLPVTGPRADFLWKSFVGLGLRREIYLRSVVQHAIDIHQREGTSWPYLFESVIGGLLDQGRTRQASAIHRQLQQLGIVQPNDLVRVIKPASHPACLQASTTSLDIAAQRRTISLGLTAFKDMCRSAPGHRIYGPVISELMQSGYGDQALRMHDFLIKHDDHPQTAEEVLDLLEYVKRHANRQQFDDIREYIKGRNFSNFNFDAPVTDQTAPPGHKSKLAGKKYNDDIGAKLISTPPFNLQWVIGALKMLGISAIGPRTLREITIRANGGKEILDKIRLIQGSGITIEDSIFPRLVEKLARQHRNILLSDLLNSDQHLDVFSDVKIQESLLISNYLTQDWRQYNLALAVLAEHFPDPLGLLDVHFRKHIAAGEYDAASRVVDEVAIHGQTLSEESVDFLAEKVLTPRQLTRGPSPGRVLSAKDEVMFVFRVLQRVVPAGSYVSKAFWVELVKRLGMNDNWNELREVCHWLVQEYSFRPRATPSLFTSKLQPTGRDGRILRQMFTERMTVAIITWGFRPRIDESVVGNENHYYKHPTTGEKYIRWVRGLVLLRELSNAGLHIDANWIRHATRLQVAKLFGQYSPSARPVNRTLRRMCPFTQQEVIAEVERAWGDMSLFHGEQWQSPQRAANPYRTASSFRRSSNVQLSRTEMRKLQERVRQGDSDVFRLMREWRDLRDHFPPKPRPDPYY